MRSGYKFESLIFNCFGCDARDSNAKRNTNRERRARGFTDPQQFTDILAIAF